MFSDRTDVAHGTPPSRTAATLPLEPAETSPRLVSYRDAMAVCDEETLRRVLDFGKHYHTDGRRPRPYWFAEDFEDCLGLVDFETNRGGLP